MPWQGGSTHSKTIRSLEVKGLWPKRNRGLVWQRLRGTEGPSRDSLRAGMRHSPAHLRVPWLAESMFRWQLCVAGVAAGIAGTTRAQPRELQAGSFVHTSQWNGRAAVVYVISVAPPSFRSGSYSSFFPPSVKYCPIRTSSSPT